MRLFHHRGPRPAEECDPERLHETGRGQRRRQRQQTTDSGHHDLQPPLGQIGALQYGLEGQPLGDEPIEGRKRRDRDAADEKDKAGQRHAMDETAQLLHVPLAGRRQHGARAEKQQALEKGVIENVEQCRGKRQCRGQPHPVGLECERETKADENDADVLDRAVGKQTLEILFHQGVEDPHYGRETAEEKHDDARPPCRRAGQVEDDPDEAIDGDFGHDAAHEGRNMTWRRRMSEWQPYVERNKAGLGTCAEQYESQDSGGDELGWLGSTHRVESVISARSRQQAESQQQRQRTEARHDEINVSCPRVVLFAMVRHDERPRGERHELPGKQEREGIVRQHDKIHAGKERREERQHPVWRRFVTAIAKAVQAGDGAPEVDDDEEKDRERIQAEMSTDPRQP